jgi:membrane protein DedA with SNARE-associated domain
VGGWLDHLVQTYGIYATFLGTAAEGETVAITSGVMAHEGYMDFGAVVVAAILGAYVSDLLFYWIGRRYRDARHVRAALSHEGVQRVTRVLARNLVVYALTFRFVPGMKTAGAMTLAALGLSPRVFAVCAAVSSIAWGVIFVSLGYFLGNLITRIFGDLERIEHALIAPALVGVALWTGVWLWRRIKGVRCLPHSSLPASPGQEKLRSFRRHSRTTKVPKKPISIGDEGVRCCARPTTTVHRTSLFLAHCTWAQTRFRRGNSAASGCGSGASASAAPSPRSGGCARGSR